MHNYYTMNTQQTHRTITAIPGFQERDANEPGECEETGMSNPGRSRANGDFAHIPYLKPLQFDNDYNSPRNHSSKGVWTFELASRAMGDVISWETPVRIRHVNSGCYLAVDM